MGQTTGIAWCDHTFNPWWGCTKVSTGCANCYAEGIAARFGHDVWGVDKPRKLASDNYWWQPVLWNRKAGGEGMRRRVFSGSMCDVFENHRECRAPRYELFSLIRQTPHLDWLLLTKRPENMAAMLPDDWRSGYENVWLGVTAENQEQADKRIPILLQTPAAVRFVSVEPMLGPVDLNRRELICKTWSRGGFTIGIYLDWVICGGESGTHARPMHPDWARGLRDQCKSADVPFFFKQWGEHIGRGQQMANGMESLMYAAGCEAFGAVPKRSIQWDDQNWAYRVGKKTAGALLDGRKWEEFPVPCSEWPACGRWEKGTG